MSKCYRNFWIWDNIQKVAYIVNIQRLAGGPDQNYFDTIFSPNSLNLFTTKVMGANNMIPILFQKKGQTGDQSFPHWRPSLNDQRPQKIC